MASAVENHWPRLSELSGLVVTRYAHGLPLERIEVIEASHPLPDGRGAAAAGQMLEAIDRLRPNDLLLVLLSGGGSSLLALPVDGVSLKDLRSVTKALLHSGASIQEINTVRKHLTQFSAGRIAERSSAPICALIISDVVSDAPTHIASGPCTPDPSTYSDALDLLAHYRIQPPESVSRHFRMGLAGLVADTPKPGNPVFARVENRVIGSARLSLQETEIYLESQGYRVINLGEIEGNATCVARHHADMIARILANSPKPFALLSGGETTVKVNNPAGRGGRNTEYLLALGLALPAHLPIWALACDTDGIDGTEDNAGAIWTPDSIARATPAGLDGVCLLENNLAYDFFTALGDLVITGPTCTNVNDFRLILAGLPQ